MTHSTKFLCMVIIGAWLALFVTSDARADNVVFSNFGPGMTFNTAQGININGSNFSGGQIPAQAFIPSGSFTFRSAQLAIVTISGPNLLQVVLMTSSGGLPGDIIESMTLTNAVPPFSSGSGIVSADSALHPALISGTQYWLVPFPSDPDTQMAWNFSLNDFSTPVVRSFSSLTGPWVPLLEPSVPRLAFQVNGSPIPEPATLLLLGTGLAGAIAAVKSRRHHAQSM